MEGEQISEQLGQFVFRNRAQLGLRSALPHDAEYRSRPQERNLRAGGRLSSLDRRPEGADVAGIGTLRRKMASDLDTDQCGEGLGPAVREIEHIAVPTLVGRARVAVLRMRTASLKPAA